MNSGFVAIFIFVAAFPIFRLLAIFATSYGTSSIKDGVFDVWGGVFDVFYWCIWYLRWLPKLVVVHK